MDVLRIPGKDWFVQFEQSRGWGCATQDGQLWFSERENFIPLLPLLEQPWPEASAFVSSACQAAQVEAEFPFEQVVQTALAWPTEHWPSLAVAWFAQGFQVSSEARQAIAALAKNKAMSQRLRHQAFSQSKARSASEA
jgi:hypothetical protein